MPTAKLGNKSPILKLPLRPSNPSALEMAIYQFQVKAYKHYHRVTNQTDSSPEELKEVKETIAHLERERAKINAHAIIEERLLRELEAYREESVRKSTTELSNEKHHPTTRLVSSLYAIAEPQPSPTHAAHHIVMGNGKVRAMIDARMQMFMYGIGINDSINGIWLPRSTAYKGHYTTPKAPTHSCIHGENYQRWVGILANIRNNEKRFKTKLTLIKKQLNDGTHPPMILKKKDPTWKPS
ncbi:AHH domain-containing protein [Thaumasiovibrio sp. DFM-14]|uniref:AHH domain-containing protein n=1 Tax=Thaumasiovibrio sp. DFM-14 TaxID=3384792 RepID=UPI0039A320E7